MKLLIKLTLALLTVTVSGQEFIAVTKTYHDSIVAEKTDSINELKLQLQTANDSLSTTCDFLKSIYNDEGVYTFIKLENKPFIIIYEDDSINAMFAKDYNSFGFKVVANDSLLFYIDEIKW